VDEGVTAAHFAPEGVGDLVGGVLGWPLRGVRAPGEVIVLEDECGTRQVRGAADDLRRVPVVLLHDLV